jgi:hypothetical protein
MSTYAARTVCIPPKADTAMETNFYMILFDLATGDLVNAGTGAVASDVSWANAAFDTDHWTAHAISGYPVVTIPALPRLKSYGVLCFDAASPAITDTPTRGGLYDAQTGSFFTDALPISNGHVKTRGYNPTVSM